MFGSSKNKITLDNETFAMIKQAAEISGCSSVEEFATQVLTREAQNVISNQGGTKQDAGDVAKITEKLRGLGYLE